MNSLQAANRQLKHFRIEEVEFDSHDEYDVREKSTGKVVDNYKTFSVARERAEELEVAEREKARETE
jgi:hypothetical protein